MKTNAVIMSLALLAGSALSAPATAAEPRIKSWLRPAAGASFDIGRSRAVAYFLQEKGACRLTVLLSEKLADDQMPSSAGTRVSTLVGGGKRARVDIPEGPSVEFICAPGATMMSLRKVKPAVYAALRK